MNETVVSFAYFVDSIDIWYSRLRHVNISYIKGMQNHGIISNINHTCMNKCEICVESKITNKTCHSIYREIELLSSIHTDFGELKQTMTRGGKKYYVAFIDDFSKYTKVYLLMS